MANTNDYDIAFRVGESVSTIADAANKVFKDREELISLFVPTMLAGQHGLLLGKPGVAKTSLLKWMTEAMNLNWFWWTLDSDTTKEDLFGSYSVKALNEDRFERVWAGLSKSHIAVLDEPGKAPNSVLNMLLTAMNERFGQSLYSPMKLPLHSLWAGSNEQFLDNAAIYDRFHMRIPVLDVHTNDDLWEVMTGDAESPVNVPIDPAHLAVCRKVADTLRQNAMQSKKLKEVTMVIKSVASKQGVEHTSRRWKESLKIAAGAAIARGDTEIKPEDLYVMYGTLWIEMSQYEPLRMEIRNLVDSEKIELEQFAAKLEKFEDELGRLKPGQASQILSIVTQVSQLHVTYRGRGKRWDNLLARAEAIVSRYLV